LAVNPNPVHLLKAMDPERDETPLAGVLPVKVDEVHETLDPE
jgi:hypothetical protein